MSFSPIQQGATFGAGLSARKSKQAREFERGYEAGRLVEDMRDNVVARVRQDGGLDGLKLSLPPSAAAPKLPALPTPADMVAQLRWLRVQEAAELNAIGRLAAGALANATSARQGALATGDARAIAAAEVTVAEAQLAVAQVEAAKADLAARPEPKPIAPVAPQKSRTGFWPLGR